MSSCEFKNRNMTKLEILNKNIDKQAQTKLGIQYTQKMKRAALESMQEYADQQLLIHVVTKQSKLLLSELVEWLVINTNLDMEKVSDFEERFKQ